MKKIMLLGSGELGKEVIISAQRLGCHVIAVDRYENAPGMQVADQSEVINMLDEHTLKNCINKYNFKKISKEKIISNTTNNFKKLFDIN